MRSRPDPGTLADMAFEIGAGSKDIHVGGLGVTPGAPRTSRPVFGLLPHPTGCH